MQSCVSMLGELASSRDRRRVRIWIWVRQHAVGASIA